MQENSKKQQNIVWRIKGTKKLKKETEMGTGTAKKNDKYFCLFLLFIFKIFKIVNIIAITVGDTFISS